MSVRPSCYRFPGNPGAHTNADSQQSVKKLLTESTQKICKNNYDAKIYSNQETSHLTTGIFHNQSFCFGQQGTCRRLRSVLQAVRSMENQSEPFRKKAEGKDSSKQALLTSTTRKTLGICEKVEAKVQLVASFPVGKKSITYICALLIFNTTVQWNICEMSLGSKGFLFSVTRTIKTLK